MAGQGYSSSSTCRSLTAESSSIVKRRDSRSLTGNHLQINNHQHHGYNIHVTRRLDAISTAVRCFERWFNSDEEWDAFCKVLRHNPFEGIYDFMDVRKLTLHLIHKLHPCHTYPIHPAKHLDEPWWKQKELECNGRNKCRCPISSSARMFGV